MSSIRHKLETISDKILKVMTEHNISLLEIKSFFRRFDLNVDASHLVSADHILNEIDSEVLSVFHHFFHLPTSCLEHDDYIAYRYFGHESEHIKENAYTWEELRAKTRWLEEKKVRWCYAVLSTAENVDVIVMACAMMFHGRVVFSAQPLVHSAGPYQAAYKALEEKILGSEHLLDLSEIRNDKQGFLHFTQDEIGSFPLCFVEFLGEEIVRKLIDFMLSENNN